MAAYKTLKGQSIRQVAQDPTNPVIGEIWYNTTIGALKARKFTAAAWASGGAGGTARQTVAGFGVVTEALVAAGEEPAGTLSAKTEEYNGSSWSEQNDMATARRILGGCGTQTAGLVFGGFTSGNLDLTEEYGGTSWTNGGALPSAIMFTPLLFLYS